MREFDFYGTICENLTRWFPNDVIYGISVTFDRSILSAARFYWYRKRGIPLPRRQENHLHESSVYNPRNRYEPLSFQLLSGETNAINNQFLKRKKKKKKNGFRQIFLPLSSLRTDWYAISANPREPIVAKIDCVTRIIVESPDAFSRESWNFSQASHSTLLIIAIH